MSLNLTVQELKERKARLEQEIQSYLNEAIYAFSGDTDVSIKEISLMLTSKHVHNVKVELDL